MAEAPLTEALRSVASELRSAFFDYLDAYFVRRDLPGTLETLAPDLTCFGTGIDEVAFLPGEAEPLYVRDLSQAPNPFAYRVENLTVQPLSEDAGVLCCVLHIATELANQKLTLNGLRMTLVFSRVDEGWRIRHKHISFPTSLHGEHEAYPLKELEERNQALQRMVEEKTRSLDEALAEISRLAVTDKLTGLFNRTKIDEVLEMEIRRALRYRRPLSILLMDLDHFKRVNDEHGHLEGDRVLRAIADLFAGTVRATDLLGCWGGEEILVICPETDGERGRILAETLRAATERADVRVPGGLTASFGVASFRPGDTPAELFGRVDQAMYRAKRGGRNRVVVEEDP